MAIIVNLDVMMAKRKIGLMELAEKINITPANLSILKNNRQRQYAFLLLRIFVKHSTVNRQIYLNTLINSNL